MYYRKTLCGSTTPTELDAPRYDRRTALKEFDFTHLIDGRNVEHLKSIASTEADSMKSNHREHALFDLAAAVVAQFHYRSRLMTKEVLREITEYFHQSLIESGFKLCSQPLRDLRRTESGGTGIEIVVPGAQTRTVLHGRVDAAVRMIAELRLTEQSIDAENPTRVNATFTGRCPERGGRILNEAGDMVLHFRESIAKDPKINPELITIFREETARNTAENLSESLKRRGSDCFNDSDFFLVSSLFHLPRLASEAESLFERIGTRPRSITLVSSQQFLNEPDPASNEVGFVKSSLFEFFRSLLESRIDNMPKSPGYGSGN